VYYAEVEKINNKNTYNKFGNEEINIFKLNHKQLKKINSSGTLQNVLTKVSIYEYFNKIKKS
jgi:tRNA G18 (ribose-2'-O)-methylase SpoU